MLFIEGESNKLSVSQNKIETNIENKYFLGPPSNNDKIDEISDLCSEMYSEDNEGSRLMTDLQSRNSKESLNLTDIPNFFPDNKNLEKSKTSETNENVKNLSDYRNKRNNRSESDIILESVSSSTPKITTKKNNDKDKNKLKNNELHNNSNITDSKSDNISTINKNNNLKDEEESINDDYSEIICSEQIKSENNDNDSSENDKYNVHNYDLFCVNSEKEDNTEFFANTFGKTDKNPEDWDESDNNNEQEYNKNEVFDIPQDDNINTVNICIKEKNFNSESEYEDESSKYSKSDSKKDFLDLNIKDYNNKSFPLVDEISKSYKYPTLKKSDDIIINNKALSQRNFSEKFLNEEFKNKKKDFSKKKNIEKFGTEIKSVKARSKSPIFGVKGSLDVDYLLKNNEQKNTNYKESQDLKKFNLMLKSLKNTIQTINDRKTKTPNWNSKNASDFQFEKHSTSKSTNHKNNSLKKCLSKSYQKRQLSPKSSTNKKIMNSETNQK